MGRIACIHKHDTTHLATRLLNTSKPSTDSLSMDLPQQDNLITDNHNTVNLNMANPNMDNLITDSNNIPSPNMANRNMANNLSMASNSMDKHHTDSFSPVPTPCLEGNPPQIPDTTHKPGWPPWEGHCLFPS